MNNHSRVNGSTRLYVLIGNTIQKSLSPIIHNTAFYRYGFNAVYVPFEIPDDCKNEEQLKAIVELSRVGNIDGMNITMPFKSKVIKYLDQCDDVAESIGAVNTIVKYENSLLGYNTDAYGFSYGLKSAGIDVEGSRCLVVGAGGAAKAVCYSLNLEGVDSITIAVRNLNAIQEFEKIKKAIVRNDTKTKIVFKSLARTSLKDYDLVVNATPVGMHGFASKFDALEANFKTDQVFFDLVYSPQETDLMRNAKKSGATIIGGLSMLVGQAIKSFEIWTGTQPDSDIIYEALEKKIGRT